MPEALTVGAIARLTGVTVRTLHHYDDVGLVRPIARSQAGYRLYGAAEIERLGEVLVLRELGFGLEEIRRIVDEPGVTREAALERQRRMVERKAEHLLRVLGAIDAALAAEKEGRAMTSEEVLGVFGGFDPAAHAEEAEERWGDTAAYRESARRTARYEQGDWEQLGREAAEIDAALVALMETGIAPTDPRAMDLAERHRAHISKWFYECSPEIHASLARMYVADPRFTDTIDRAAPGLAAYLSAAIDANATRR